MLYKFGYWIGEDDGSELNLITELATSDPRFAAESIKSIGYAIEETYDDPRAAEVAGLELKVSTLTKMLNKAERELDRLTRKEEPEDIPDVKLRREGASLTLEEALTAEAPDDSASQTTQDLWEEAKSKIQQAVDLTSRNIAHAVAARAGHLIDEQSVLAANLQKKVG